MTISDFNPIHEYHYVPFWHATPFLVACGIGTFLLCALIAFLLWRRIAAARARRKMSAWEWAESELFSLAADTRSSKEEFKHFYFSLTGIIKRYLERRYGWRVSDKTDDELAAFLRSKKFDEHMCKDIEQMARRVMEIKYADAQTLTQNAGEDLATARMIVGKTKPLEGD